MTTIKKTISFSADPVLVEGIRQFADSVGMSRSNVLNNLIEKFLYAHERAKEVTDPEEYVIKTNSQGSYYCPTNLGVMMTFNFDMDFHVAQKVEE